MYLSTGIGDVRFEEKGDQKQAERSPYNAAERFPGRPKSMQGCYKTKV